MKILKASDITTKYSPTKEDLSNLIKKDNTFKLSGDRIFHTIQGEGATLGKPATFVRLHFCNLSCSWCDTWYTWHRDTEQYYKEPFDMSVSELHRGIRNAQAAKGVSEENHVYRVIFTGGEPMLQQNEIAQFLIENPVYICEIETNGTIAPNEFLQKLCKEDRIRFNCSPKLANSGNNSKIAFNQNVLKILASFPTTIFKFVCNKPNDIDEILEKFNFLPRGQIVIMPEGVTKEENAGAYERIINKIIELSLTTYPRLQNICFDGSKRGV